VPMLPTNWLNHYRRRRPEHNRMYLVHGVCCGLWPARIFDLTALECPYLFPIRPETCVAHQPRTLLATNSSPLSERMKAGGPRRMDRSVTAMRTMRPLASNPL